MSASERFELVMTSLDEDFNELERVKFEYKYPFVDKSTTGRTVTHEPIGREPVVQYMGSELLEVTIEGHCYLDEANFIDGLSENGLVDVICDRWNGTGMVNKAQTSATGEGGGPRGGTNERIYEYTLTVYEVTNNAPESVSGS